MDQTVALPACVASFAPRDPADARRLVALVPEKATAVEMRLDHWREAGSVEELLSIGPRPVIVTYRTRAQGGDFAGSSEEYRRLVAGAHAAGATVDVEHASGLLDDPTQLADRGRVIVSHHSPFSIPEDWRDRLAAMLACRDIERPRQNRSERRARAADDPAREHADESDPGDHPNCAFSVSSAPILRGPI